MSEWEEVICPFCKEADFDLIGLEIHLMNNWCDIYGTLRAAAKQKSSSEG